eukprot:1687548-Rhodomonas_salina.1
MVVGARGSDWAAQRRVADLAASRTRQRRMAAIDDEAREQLKIDAAEGLQAMGCASMKNTWYEFQLYDLPELTT